MIIGAEGQIGLGCHPARGSFSVLEGGTDLADERLDVAARRWCLQSAQDGRDDLGCRRNMMGEEEVAQLLLGGHRSRRQVEKPHARDTGKGHGQPVRHDLVVAPGLEDSFFICQ